MKIILLLSTIIVFTPAYAGIYKCQNNEEISYQSDPCKNNTGVKFKLNQDISSEQHQIALQKLKLELIEREKMERISKENYNKERSMHVNEKIANASYLNVIQSSRQADALELRNRIEVNKPSRHRNFY